jgi:hypothetical protein
LELEALYFWVLAAALIELAVYEVAITISRIIREIFQKSQHICILSFQNYLVKISKQDHSATVETRSQPKMRQ